MPSPIKRFVIEITRNTNHPSIWYADKIGRTFEAQLLDGKYKVTDLHCVIPRDCKEIVEIVPGLIVKNVTRPIAEYSNR